MTIVVNGRNGNEGEKAREILRATKQRKYVIIIFQNIFLGVQSSVKERWAFLSSRTVYTHTHTQKHPFQEIISDLAPTQINIWGKNPKIREFPWTHLSEPRLRASNQLAPVEKRENNLACDRFVCPSYEIPNTGRRVETGPNLLEEGLPVTDLGVVVLDVEGKPLCTAGGVDAHRPGVRVPVLSGGGC